MLATISLVVGTGLRCITANPSPATWLIHTGQIIIGLGGPVGQASATLLSSAWFPPNQRITATAIGSLACYCGTALSFVIGPHLVDDFDSVNVNPGDREQEIHRLSDQIMRMMYIHFGFTCGLFVLAVLSFPAKPPKPPSATATMERVVFKDGLIKLFKNPQFQLIALAYGLTTGVYSAWCSDLALNLKSFDIPNETASWLGFWAVISGAVSGITLSL